MKFSCIMTFLLMVSTASFAKTHFIYSVSEEVPMGYENEKLKKNFYLDIGEEQGVTSGTLLDVYRTIAKINPYDGKRMINYKVRIGTMEIVHSETQASIGIVKEVFLDHKTAMFDVKSFMIGDHVEVNVKE